MAPPYGEYAVDNWRLAAYTAKKDETRYGENQQHPLGILITVSIPLADCDLSVADT